MLFYKRGFVAIRVKFKPGQMEVMTITKIISRLTIDSAKFELDQTCLRTTVLLVSFIIKDLTEKSVNFSTLATSNIRLLLFFGKEDQ